MELKPGYKQTEVGVIPEDWDVKKLKDVAEIRSGIAKNSKAVVANPVEISYLRVANVQDGYLDLSDISTITLSRDDINRYTVMPGDVLMNEGGDLDKLGRGAIWRGDLSPIVHQNHVFVVRCKKVILPEFLNAWTSGSASRRYFLVAGKQTTNLASINKSSLGGLPIALPCPSEQQKIAEALNELNSLIQSLNELIAKKHDIKQAAMQELLTGKRRLPGFEGEWGVKRLGEVMKFQVGFPFSSTFFNDKEQGVRLVKNRDLKSDDQVFHYSGQYDPSFQVRDGDVLVGMDGDFLPCRWAKGTALLNQRVGRIVPMPGLNLAFAFYYLMSPLKEIEIATGSTTVKHLSHGDIESIEKPLPSVPEQTAIADVLSEMDAELAALEARRDKTRELKQGMMQELLTGRIRLT
jgi:type I restriction enzyme S subunit